MKTPLHSSFQMYQQTTNFNPQMHLTIIDQKQMAQLLNNKDWLVYDAKFNN